MPVQPYLLRLTPSEAFFFGSERTFGEDNAMYFVRSNRFPQQTTLLGIIRFKLLESIGKLGRQYEPEAINLIGSQSFNITSKNTCFGVIKALSPVFLLQGDDVYQYAPKDWGHQFQYEKYLPLLCSVSKNKEGQYPAFNPKDGLPELFINATQKEKKPEDIFHSEIRTGITKNSHEEDSKGFYKQEVFRFTSRDWAFGVIVWLADNGGETLTAHLKNNPWARLGTENRQAKLELSPVSKVSSYLQAPLGVKPDSEDIRKVILLNHAYADRCIYKDCVFAITETIDFRNIETSAKTRDFSALDRKKEENTSKAKDAPYRSDTKLNLLERGSVFYVSNHKLDYFKNKLLQAQHFRTIGYNAYQVEEEPFYYSPNN